MNISLRGSGSTDTILLCNRRVTSRPDSGRRSALLRENVPGTVTHTLNSGSYIFIPRCLHQRKTLSAGRNITLLIAGLNGYSCLSPYLARCPRTFLAGATGDSRMQLTEATRQCLTAPETGWVSFLTYLRRKGRADRCHTKNRAYSGTNFPAAFRRLYQSGYSRKFLAEFLGLGPY